MFSVPYKTARVHTYMQKAVSLWVDTGCWMCVCTPWTMIINISVDMLLFFFKPWPFLVDHHLNTQIEFKKIYYRTGLFADDSLHVDNVWNKFSINEIILWTTLVWNSADLIEFKKLCYSIFLPKPNQTLHFHTSVIFLVFKRNYNTTSRYR